MDGGAVTEERSGLSSGPGEGFNPVWDFVRDRTLFVG